MLAHEGLPFANPLSEADVEQGIAALDLPDGARVLETGCGAAEVLVRVLVRYPSAVGVGVDSDADWLSRARGTRTRASPGGRSTSCTRPRTTRGSAPGPSMPS